MIFTDEMIKRFNENSLYRTLGIRLAAAGDGKAVSKLRPRKAVCWPFAGQPHGGVLFTLMDTTMAWAVLSSADHGVNCATVDIEIQYPLPAKGPVFTCDSRVTARTRRSCFVRGEFVDADDRPVALAQATFRILRGEALY